MTRFSAHFTVEELACPTTGEIDMEPGFIEALEMLRVGFDKPMIVTSGCRSGAHNALLLSRAYDASPNSLHLMANEKYGTKTCAVDIRRPAGPDLHRLVQVALNSGWSIGIARTFVHLDLRSQFAGLPETIYTY